jgi:hypothetical protein
LPNNKAQDKLLLLKIIKKHPLEVNLKPSISKSTPEINVISFVRSLAFLGRAEGPEASTLKPEPLIYDRLFLPCLFPCLIVSWLAKHLRNFHLLN